MKLRHSLMGATAFCPTGVVVTTCCYCAVSDSESGFLLSTSSLDLEGILSKQIHLTTYIPCVRVCILA